MEKLVLSYAMITFMQTQLETNAFKFSACSGRQSISREPSATSLNVKTAIT